MPNDYTLIGSDGKAVQCNKGLLSLYSKLFDRAGKSEAFHDVETARQAKFDELDSEAISLAMDYTYTRELPGEMTEEVATKLWKAAEVFEMPELKEKLLSSDAIQVDTDELDPAIIMELAVLFKEQRVLPQLFDKDVVALWDLAKAMEIPDLKAYLKKNYDLRFHLYSKIVALDVQKWRDAGIAIDPEREQIAQINLPSVKDFDSISNSQDLLWIPGGLSGKEMAEYFSALIEDENLKAHLLALIELDQIQTRDQWLLLYKREMEENEHPDGYAVFNRIAFKSIPLSF
ncbi:MAG: BTB/POZ domain-containing protein [Parachlamydiaceae bacterium]